MKLEFVSYSIFTNEQGLVYCVDALYCQNIVTSVVTPTTVSALSQVL